MEPGCHGFNQQLIDGAVGRGPSSGDPWRDLTVAVRIHVARPIPTAILPEFDPLSNVIYQVHGRHLNQLIVGEAVGGETDLGANRGDPR